MTFRLVRTQSAIDRLAWLVSSLRIVPLAVAVPMVVPAAGFDSVTVKPRWLHDRVASDVDGDRLAGLPRREVYRARRQDRTAKSDPAAGFAPLPVTAQPALSRAGVAARVTVKVNGVLPD